VSDGGYTNVVLPYWWDITGSALLQIPYLNQGPLRRRGKPEKGKRGGKGKARKRRKHP